MSGNKPYEMWTLQLVQTYELCIILSWWPNCLDVTCFFKLWAYEYDIIVSYDELHCHGCVWLVLDPEVNE
jgi:hypothetical protein